MLSLSSFRNTLVSAPSTGATEPDAVLLLSDLGSDEMQAVVRHLRPRDVCSLKRACRALAVAAEPQHPKWKDLREAVRCSGWASNMACDWAAHAGDVDWLLWLRKQGCRWGPSTCQHAAMGGQLETLQWLRAQGLEWNEGTWMGAVASDRTDLLEWLLAQASPPPRSDQICITAAYLGHLEGLKWLREHGLEWSSQMWWSAAFNGKLEILKYVRLQGNLPWTEEVCKAAACRGHLVVLQWLRAQVPPCPWNASTCAAAARGGHFAVMRWACAQGCELDEESCAEACRCGGGRSIEILQFLREQVPPCPWDARSCAAAAEEGHLDVLLYLRSQTPPCPWDSTACKMAARDGRPTAVLRWLRTQTPPCPWDESVCLAATKFDGVLETLKWLRSQSPPCPWNANACLMATQGRHNPDPRMVWWLAHQTAREGDDLGCLLAAAAGDLQLLRSLCDLSPCPWRALWCTRAAEGGRLEVGDSGFLIYICIICIYVYRYVHIYYICIYVCMYVFMYVYIYVDIFYVDIYTYKYI